jgi:hypothetical protein
MLPWAPLSAARREQEALPEETALEDIFAIGDRIEGQDAASLLATQERDRNIADRNRLNEFRLSVQAQDSKRARSVESIAAARTRIETFETTNAQLIEDAAQGALNVERDAPIKLAYDSFLERLRAFRNELPGTLMAGLNDIAMTLYNGFNREDRAEDKLAALYLPLTGDQKIEIAFCGNPRRRVDALHVLSEGHIRCLGLAILLAKAQSSDCPLIIFDDAINAIDHDHRAGIRETVFESDHFTDAQLIAGGVDEPCHLLLTQDGWQALMALGKRNRIRQVGPAERLDEQEPQCRCLSFDGARRELPIAEQMNLVLANVVRPQPIRRPAKIPGELLDRMDIGPYGVRRVVATLELIQHHLAKMGHSEPPCDTHLSLNYRQNPPMLQHPPRQRLRSNDRTLSGLPRAETRRSSRDLPRGSFDRAV